MYSSHNLKRQLQSFVLDRLLHKMLFNKILNGLGMLRYRFFEYDDMSPDPVFQNDPGLICNRAQQLS